jgi:hypothetical protein
VWEIIMNHTTWRIAALALLTAAGALACAPGPTDEDGESSQAAATASPKKADNSMEGYCRFQSDRFPSRTDEEGFASVTIYKQACTACSRATCRESRDRDSDSRMDCASSCEAWSDLESTEPIDWLLKKTQYERVQLCASKTVGPALDCLALAQEAAKGRR